MPDPQKEPDLETTAERRALDDLFSVVYEELRRLASFARRADAHATISSTALVHEAWLKLRNSPGLASKTLPHFKSIAAKAMRQILVDEARRRHARKRGGAGEASLVAFDESAEPVISSDEELLALNDALDELARLSSRQAQVVESRFFGGLSIAETGALLGVSESAVERDWRAARAWLASNMQKQE
jgi:RNA polymerase sigma factor (TIGR02999 family)